MTLLIEIMPNVKKKKKKKAFLNQSGGFEREQDITQFPSTVALVAAGKQGKSAHQLSKNKPGAFGSSMW